MNYTIHFLPDDKKITVPEGTLISDAAVMAEVGSLHLPCGGKGTCGRCNVQIEPVSDPSKTREAPACKTRINAHLIVRITATEQIPESCIVSSSSIQNYKWDTSSLSPLCRKTVLKIEAPTIDDNYSDMERLEHSLNKHFGNGQVQCSLQLLQSLASAVREKDGLISVFVNSINGLHEIISVEPGDTGDHFGIACDIGTTTVSLHLVNLSSGEIICTKSDYNRQVSRGGDIISRIEYGKSPIRLKELRDLITGTINSLINSACKQASISCNSIQAISISGNCTMIHLFLGLAPRYIREHPYVPTVNRVPILNAEECELNINNRAPIFFSPGVGSYVGGDITSGLLCTDMIHDRDKVSLFIDIGTNGEIVIGNREFLMTCACSAGPAFEGSGISCGMRAAPGAIDSFTIDSSCSIVDYTVIGGILPEGICGSGLISLVGQLLHSEYIDRSGKFTDNIEPSRLVTIGGTRGMVLVPAKSTSSSKDIIVTEADIENLIRTKAAIYAACDLMLKNVGIGFNDIHQILIAGGFGSFIDIDQAVKIGLFPDVKRSRFRYLGNTSLAGAYFSLLNQGYRDELISLSRKMTYVELSNDPKYMDSYVAALFLPHTDLQAFQSI